MSEQKFPGRIWITNPDTDFLRMQNLGPQHEWLHLTEHQHILAEKDERIEELREALSYYADYMSGDAPEFTKSGWQKYPDPKIARAALQEDGK